MQDLSMDYTTPCYWSINAFSNNTFEVTHRHAFQGMKQTIKETVESYSIFTWPMGKSYIYINVN